MKFLFQVTSLDTDAPKAQVSAALETRTQLLSRARMPGLWKYTDKLNAAQYSKSRGISVRLRGAIFLALDIFLLVPSLMDPAKLLMPLLAGLAATVWGLFLLRGKKVGASAMNRRFDAAAETLLTHMAEALDTHSFQAEFTDSDLILTTESASDGTQSEAVAYSELEYIIETEDLFLLTYREQAVLLPKQALVTGSCDEFQSFLTQRASLFPALSEKGRI